jgi:hypothetical protein
MSVADARLRTRFGTAALRLLGAIGIFLGVIEGARVIQAWYLGERTLTGWDWFWLALLPLCVFAFLRYYSIFRSDFRACELPDDKR